ncbi:MAG: FAD binding domain-containing protein [Spirochaetota bacterium]
MATTTETAFVPVTLDEALEVRGRERVEPVAGGTDLMVRHRPAAPIPVRLESPPLFLGHLRELRGVRPEDGALTIGSATTLSELDAHPACDPAVRELLRWFASPAIRNAATVGGNVCNASPAADLVPWLVARGTTVRLRSGGAGRTMPVEDFVTGPAMTALRPDELLVELRVPVRPDHGLWFYRKVAPRRSNALSKLSIYAEAERAEDGTVSRFALALGAVAPTVVRSPDAEAMLVGCRAHDLAARLPEVLERYGALVHPIDDQRSTSAYRSRTGLRLVRHVIASELARYLEQP